MIVYFPLEHIDQRYTTHLDRDVLAYLKRNRIEFEYIEPKVLSNEIKAGSFLDAPNTVYRQCMQMAQLIEKVENGTIPKGFTLFTTDIWNFSLSAVPYLNFFADYDIKLRGVLHAGSFTDTDFVRQMERVYKGFEEILFDIADKIFVASEFIRADVIQKRFVDPEKLIVSKLPLDISGIKNTKHQPKEDIVIFNGRLVGEKQPDLFDMIAQRMPEYKFIKTHELNLPKQEYYDLLMKSKCVVSFALQENFGYGIQEAVLLGCVPVLPNRLVYPSQFHDKHLYNNLIECEEMIHKAMKGETNPIHTIISESSNSYVFNKWFHT